MDVHLFGDIDIDLGARRLDARSFRGRKPKQLLEVLLVRRGVPVPTDEIASLLWGDAPPPDVRGTVQHYVSLLRRQLPRDRLAGSVVLHGRGGYTLDPCRFTLDLDRFDEAAVAAEVAPTAQRRALLRGALDLVRGVVLADEPDASWATDVRARYQRAHVSMLLQASAAALADAEPDTARDLAMTAVGQDPYAEPAACLLMAAHYAAGNGQAALASFERCRQGLTEALGVDPLPRTLDMHRAILRHAPVTELVTQALQLAHAYRSGGALRVPA